MKEYGYFLDNGKDFLITEPNIPRNWYNYLWNDDYVTFISQTGAGESFLQDELGRRQKLVKERGFFIIEDDIHWGIGGLPVNEKRDEYSCTHSHGETEIYTENHEVVSTVSVMVPRKGAFELWRLKIKNRSDKTRRLKVVAFSDTMLDAAYTRQGYNTVANVYDDELGGLYYEKRHTNMHGKTTDIYGFMASADKPDSYNGAYNQIIGPYGSFAYPAVVENGGCTATVGCGEKLAFALEKNFTLSPNAEAEFVIMLGLAYSLKEAKEMVKLYANGNYYANEVMAVKEKFAMEENDVSITTPDEKLNYMFEWLKHQTNLGSRWARVRHNGFRDMTSDTDCLACFNPELALRRFLRILTYQYPNGYAPRTFIDGEIKTHNFSDNTVWLNFTAMSIIKELGRPEILDIEVAYNDGSVGTVYEHLYRSVDYLYHFRGHHNLIKIWGGDWNDCMNEAGTKGKGVSVWLSIAWYRANKFFEEIARMHGNVEDAEIVRVRGEEMRDIVEKYGWDGEYYIDAINDDMVKIGSRECEEGKLFLIPQIWSVLSGISRSGREAIAMDSVEKYLSDPLGTLISYPAYTKYDSGIGSVTLKHAGIHENGGVYLHTIAWKIAADAMLKRAERVEEGIETILPFRNKVVAGRAEPYIMCNSYFGKQTGYRYGTPGQSWRTAAGQWFLKAIVNYVFGLLPELDGLKIDPCIPPSWRTPSITKIFRGTTYHIKYKNGGTRVKAIFVDGKEIKGNILPLTGKATTVLVVTE